MKTIYILSGENDKNKFNLEKTNLAGIEVLEFDKNLDCLEKFLKNISQTFENTNQIIVQGIEDKNIDKLLENLSDIKPKFVLIKFDEKAHIFLENKFAEIWVIKNGEILSKKQKVFIASTNPGKISVYKQMFDELNIEVTSLLEIGVDEKIEETGETEAENAIIKAKAYHKITGLPVFSNDSGLIIDKFSKDDQPGVLVRRFHGKELTDQQLLNVYIQKLKEVGGESDGHFNVALSLIDYDGNIHTKEFKPFHHFVSTPSKVLNKGFPLSSLSFDKETNKYESEMTFEEKTRREKKVMEDQKLFIKEIFAK